MTGALSELWFNVNSEFKVLMFAVIHKDISSISDG